jgi:hypothetical protein
MDDDPEIAAELERMRKELRRKKEAQLMHQNAEAKEEEERKARERKVAREAAIAMTGFQNLAIRAKGVDFVGTQDQLLSHLSMNRQRVEEMEKQPPISFVDTRCVQVFQSCVPMSFAIAFSNVADLFLFTLQDSKKRILVLIVLTHLQILHRLGTSLSQDEQGRASDI